MKLVWCLLVASSALINFSATLEHVYQIHPPAAHYAVPAVPAPIYYTNPPVVVNTVNDVVYAQKFSANNLPYYSDVDSSGHGITFASPNAQYTRTFHGSSNLRNSQNFAPSNNGKNQQARFYDNSQRTPVYENSYRSANYESQRSNENNQQKSSFNENSQKSDNQKSPSLVLQKGNSVTINSPTVRLTKVTSEKSNVASRSDFNNQQARFAPRNQQKQQNQQYNSQQSNYGPPQYQQNNYPVQQSANYEDPAESNQFSQDSQNVVINQGPATKTRKYEVRRPAIQKQFYDIEEHIIVRPVGTALVELDQPTSNTHKGAGKNSQFSSQRFDDSQQYDQNEPSLSQEENDRHQKFHDEQAKILQRQQMIQQQQIEQSQRLQAQQQAQQYEQLQRMQEQQANQQQNLQAGNNDGNDGYDDGQYRPNEENYQGEPEYNEGPENDPQYAQNQNTQNFRPNNYPQYIQSQKQQYRPQNIPNQQQFVQIRPQNPPRQQFIQQPAQYIPITPQNTQGFYPSSTPSQGFYPSSTPSQGFYPSSTPQTFYPTSTPSYDQTNDNSQGNGPYDDVENDAVVVEARSNPDCPPKNNTQASQRSAYVQPARNQAKNNTFLRSNDSIDTNVPVNNTSSAKTFKVETSTRITLEDDDDVEENPDNIKNVQINDESDASNDRSNNQGSNQRAQDGATRGDISSRQSYPSQQPPYQNNYPQERDFPLDPQAEYIPGRSEPPPTYNPQPPTYYPQQPRAFTPRPSYVPLPRPQQPPNFFPQYPQFPQYPNQGPQVFIRRQNPQQPNYVPQQPRNIHQPNYVPQQPNFIPQQPNFVPQQPREIPQPNYVPQQPSFVPQQPNYVPQQPRNIPQPNYVPQQPSYVPQQPTIVNRPQPTPTVPILPQKPTFVNRPQTQPTISRSNLPQEPKDVNVQVNVQTRSGGEPNVVQVKPAIPIITTDLENKINNGPSTIIISKKNSPQEAHDNQRHYIRLLTEKKNVAEIGFGNRQAEDEQIHAGHVRGRVISATPSQNSEPTKEHVNTRRIVISRPVETIQEIEVIEHETNVTPRSHGQPPVYTTVGPPAFGY